MHKNILINYISHTNIYINYFKLIFIKMYVYILMHPDHNFFKIPAKSGCMR